MPTVEITALQPAVDLVQASRHLAVLHGDAPGYGSLNLLGIGRRERHCFFSHDDLVDASNVDESRETLQSVVNDGWNVYTSLSTFRQIPSTGRGTRADVVSVPGVWADVDVKPDVEDYFQTEAEACDFVARLPAPTLEIASGSGGRHLYWLTHDRLTAGEGHRLLLAWLDFLREVALGRTIENVHDTTRILRLAGTVRWPKVGENALPRPVEIVAEGPHYHHHELRTYAESAYAEGQSRRDEARTRRARELARRNANLTPAGVSNVAHWQGVFDQEQQWDELLLRDRWTLHSDVTGGVARCRFWTRPGKNVADGKSASTDYTDERGVTSQRMSIYTNDPALVELRENADTHDGVGICTKWRFALIRLYAGNENQLIKDVSTHAGRLP